MMIDPAQGFQKLDQSAMVNKMLSGTFNGVHTRQPIQQSLTSGRRRPSEPAPVHSFSSIFALFARAVPEVEECAASRICESKHGTKSPDRWVLLRLSALETFIHLSGNGVGVQTMIGIVRSKRRDTPHLGLQAPHGPGRRRPAMGPVEVGRCPIGAPFVAPRRNILPGQGPPALGEHGPARRRDGEAGSAGEATSQGARGHDGVAGGGLREMWSAKSDKTRDQGPLGGFTAYMPPPPLFLVLVVVLPLTAAQDLAPLPLRIGQLVGNTTAGAPSSIFSQGSGQTFGGQLVYTFNVPAGVTYNLLMTTCYPVTNFRSALYLTSDSPFDLFYPEIQVLNSNAFDSQCKGESGENRSMFAATMEQRVEGQSPNGTDLFLIVTGTEGSEGNFSLSINVSNVSVPSVPWGLDRIDQHDLPLDERFTVPPEDGKNAWIYVLDTGVRATHDELAGRYEGGYGFVDGSNNPDDCNGYGTAVASVAAGRNVGVSRSSRVVGVRVLNCSRGGLVSNAEQGVRWVISDVETNGRTPAVALFSFQVGAISETLNQAVSDMISSGIPVVAAAGLGGYNACNTSLAQVPAVIMVGAIEKEVDRVANFSNRGSCVTLYAPGVEIPAAWYTGDFAHRFLNGTSMGAAHVAGVVANLISANPSLTPEQAKNIITEIATSGHLVDLGAGDRNEILYARSIPVSVESASIPSPSFLYIFFLAWVSNANSCASDVLDPVQQAVAGMLGIASGLVTIPNCVPADSAPTRQTQDISVLFRIIAPESDVTGQFVLLDKNLRVGLLDDATGLKTNVTEFPWAVDSRGYVYWTVPAIESSTAEDGTNLNLAAVILGTLGGLVAVLLLSWAASRMWQASKKSEAESTEESPSSGSEPKSPLRLGISPFGEPIGGEAFVTTVPGIESTESPLPSHEEGGRALVVSSSPVAAVGMSLSHPNGDTTMMQSIGGEAMVVSAAALGAGSNWSSSDHASFLPVRRSEELRSVRPTTTGMGGQRRNMNSPVPMDPSRLPAPYQNSSLGDENLISEPQRRAPAPHRNSFLGEDTLTSGPPTSLRRQPDPYRSPSLGEGTLAGELFEESLGLPGPAESSGGSRPGVEATSGWRSSSGANEALFVPTETGTGFTIEWDPSQAGEHPFM